MKRAHNQEQKDQRRRDILDKARHALSTRDYQDIRLADLASDMGLVKGTFYRYFATRHDLFMAVYREELEAWLADWSGTGANTGPDSGTGTGSPLPGLWVDTLVARPLLVRLIGSFPGGVEPELSPEGLRDFKFFMKDYLGRSAMALAVQVPKLAGQAVPLLIDLFILVQGTAGLAFPPARVAELLDQEADLAVFRLDLRSLLAPLLLAVWKQRLSTSH